MSQPTLEQFQADALAFLEANAPRKEAEKKFVWGEGNDKVAMFEEKDRAAEKLDVADEASVGTAAWASEDAALDQRETAAVGPHGEHGEADGWRSRRAGRDAEEARLCRREREEEGVVRGEQAAALVGGDQATRRTPDERRVAHLDDGRLLARRADLRHDRFWSRKQAREGENGCVERLGGWHRELSEACAA